MRRLDAKDVVDLGDAITLAPTLPPPAVEPRASSLRALAPVSIPHVTPLARRDEQRPCFDAYVMVDWSGSASPSTGENSIWLARGEWSAGRQLAVVSSNTRQEAVDTLVEWCHALRAKRLLVGLDFAFGYPSGLADAVNTVGADQLPWAAVHEYFGKHVIDRPDNTHNIYAVAEGLNENLGGGGPGPFWGCPPTRASTALTTRRIGQFAFPYHGLREWRFTEQRARARATTQSVWKLNCGVSVGGQTILGIHRLQQIRRALGERASIWPFESGWRVPERPDGVVLAEIFPSVLPLLEVAGGGIKDERQVRSCVWHAAARDVEGTLERAFAEPGGLTGEQSSAVTREEGWILFV